MRGKLRAVMESRHGWYVAGLVNWSPAMVFFGIYLATQDLLFLSYAVAFAMWQQFKGLRRL